MTFTRAKLLTLMAAVTLTAWAAPAPWYQWKSKRTGKLLCAQTPLGQGWEIHDGPFQDARCLKRGRIT